MSNTGWVIAGQGRNVDRSQGDWTNPGNITADDGTNATNSGVTTGGDTTDWIVADTFALSALIPSNATIRGFEMKIQALSSLSSVTGFKGVNAGKADGTLGTQKDVSYTITTSAVDYFFGGPQDLWGLTWTRTEAVAAGTQVRAFFENDSKTTSATFTVDAIWIRVWFTIPGETIIFLTTTGASQTWTAPADWNSLNNTVECLGGGGGAIKFGSNTCAGGSGGGAYSLKSNVALGPSTSINYRVGDGTDGSNDTWFNGTTLGNASCSAEGGAANSGITGGAGGQASNSVGDTKYSGGNGGNSNGAANDGGGGGGGAAGPHGNGANGGIGAAVDNDDAGAGGGGADGGAAGSDGGDSVGGTGGANRQGYGGGASNGSAGSNGGGGGGADVQSHNGGTASVETLWRSTAGATAGPGSGAGGGSANTGNGGTVATYGGGAGGSNASYSAAQGIIVITYFANASKTRTYIVG